MRLGFMYTHASSKTGHQPESVITNVLLGSLFEYYLSGADPEEGMGSIDPPLFTRNMDTQANQ